MKKRKVLSVILVLLTMGFVGCQKEDMNESGPASMGVKMVALNTSYSLPVVNSSTKSAVASPAIAWDEVQMVVSEVELEAELKSLITHEDSIEIEYKWKGPQVVNLLDSTQSFGNFILQPGFYDEIELKVEGEREDAHPEPVFYMSGNYTNAADETISVVVEVYSDLEFKTEKESVEVTEDNQDITSTIQLYLDELMAGISPEQLDNATFSEGVIVISEDSNSQLFQSVLGKLAEDRECRYRHKNWYDDDDDDD
ncbi:hypothetical protein SAMN05444280_1386 [Tangfeifania diversioriginum]|uniref:DUF4382 domain-containing protein n=1 Tax=Tangfeifania diversioriginum TaxID=1168035 RepID=A0A1M6N0B7_9BACT|nr:hypothetical protein [Tangfeifania diversioriginum]SHJ89189.1 hypothetical protein SAMN05444280_1386 [Tangfeifania diversioriginum]